MEFEMEHETNHVTLLSPNPLLQWSQWQLLDSLLPTGGFAHSYGLEAAIQSRLVSNQEDLKSYIIQVLENTEIPSLKKIRDNCLGSGVVSFHHAPIFGLICGLLGFEASTSQRAYMFITMRDVISAATRLNLIGPLGASVLQHEIAIIGEEMAKRWMDRDVDDACQTAPLVDVVQGCHGYLFSRMFCS